MRSRAGSASEWRWDARSSVNQKYFCSNEPLSNLDTALRVGTRGEITRQQREIGTTTIYVTHDQAEAMTMGHRICIMNAGEVVQTGAPLAVYRLPANVFVARFLGSPPMNLLPARLVAAAGSAKMQFDGTTFDLPDWPLDALGAHLNHEVTLGIRPEDLHERPVVPMPRLKAQMRVIEPLGAETILVLAAGDQNHQLPARVGRETSFRVGELVEIGVDVKAIHLLDAATGKAIFRPSG